MTSQDLLWWVGLGTPSSTHTATCLLSLSRGMGEKDSDSEQGDL